MPKLPISSLPLPKYIYPPFIKKITTPPLHFKYLDAILSKKFKQKYFNRKEYIYVCNKY